MATPSTTIHEVRVSGLWNTTHTLSTDGETRGVLSVRRKGPGLVTEGRYVPTKGEELLMRRDPGLLRSQFSLWTEGGEWLGSSLRWSFVARAIVLHTGSRPLRMLPVAGLRSGWSLVAPKTGEMARILCAPGSRKARIEVYRRMDFELVLFSYFLGYQVRVESIWPGPAIDNRGQAVGAAAAKSS